MNAEKWMHAKLKALAKQIPHEHFVWGLGHLNPKDPGAMLIDVALSRSSHGQRYLAEYNHNFSHIDVIGRVHVAFPEAPHVWDTQQVASRVSKSIASIVKSRYLLLCGARRRDDVYSWISLYRDGRPFTQKESDYARYTIPFLANEWMRKLVDEGLLQSPYGATDGTTMERIFPADQLTTRDVVIALASAQHVTPDEMISRVRDFDGAEDQFVRGAVREYGRTNTDSVEQQKETNRKAEQRVREKLGEIDRHDLLSLFRALRNSR